MSGIWPVAKSPRKRCEATSHNLGPSLVLQCKERLGHNGPHFADVIVNGIACDTCWTDDQPGTPEAFTSTPSSVSGSTSGVVPSPEEKT